MEYKIGDRVTACVRKGNNADRMIETESERNGSYDYIEKINSHDIVEFLIIGEMGSIEDKTVLLLIDDSTIRGWEITPEDLIPYRIDKKYLAMRTWQVDIDMVRLVSKEEKKPPTGHNCVICHEWHTWATINQTNGSFACWSCRHDPRNMLEV